jgi:hypothetical protein
VIAGIGGDFRGFKTGARTLSRQFFSISTGFQVTPAGCLATVFPLIALDPTARSACSQITRHLHRAGLRHRWRNGRVNENTRSETVYCV